MSTPLKRHPSQDTNRQVSPLPLRDRIDNRISKSKPSPNKVSQRGLSQTSRQSRDQLYDNPDERTNAMNSPNQSQPHHFYLNIKDMSRDMSFQQKGKTISISSAQKSQEPIHLTIKEPKFRPGYNNYSQMPGKQIPTSRKSSIIAHYSSN